MSVMLFSNNPLMQSLRTPKWSCHYFAGSALEVLTAARDAIHRGACLLHHPLYGNYRPYQQPYRTILVKEPSSSSSDTDAASCGTNIAPRQADLFSLHLIEEALLVFQNSRVVSPAEAPDALLQDCSVIDFELMRLPLVQAGWVEHALHTSPLG